MQKVNIEIVIKDDCVFIYMCGMDSIQTRNNLRSILSIVHAFAKILIC